MLIVDYILVVVILIASAFALVRLWKHTQLASWLQDQQFTPFQPEEKDFKQLLKTIKDLDMESKIRIIQSVIGNKINLSIISSEKNLAIVGAVYDSEDTEKLMREDSSVG